jgi:hypothetical protein
MLGQLQHCLQEGVAYDPGKAFPNAGVGSATAAAT